MKITMKISSSAFSSLPLLLIVLLFLLASSSSSSADQSEDFANCLATAFWRRGVVDATYTPQNTSYSSLLSSSIQNLRFASASTPKPLAIVMAENDYYIQDTMECAVQLGLEIRLRNGGHDFEGQSYTTGTKTPFVLVDLKNFREITMSTTPGNILVDPGATIGELHYAVAKENKTLAFVGSEYPTVGVTGFISGGGYGPLMRKYGLAADNVVEAMLLVANRTLYAELSYLKDAFWAIRGGGASNFGVIVRWTLKLVPVPETVSVFTIRKSLPISQAVALVDKWQHTAPNLNKDVYLKLKTTREAASTPTLIQVSFEALFLGGVDRLLSLMRRNFPEIGVERADCHEMSWAESLVYFASGSKTGQPLEILLDRKTPNKNYFKVKSDYATEPISTQGLEGLLKILLELEPGAGELVWIPHGGRMSEIPATRIAYPHRAGTLFMLHQAVQWQDSDDMAAKEHLNWIERIHNYLTPHVSKSPRAAYANYRDLDLGVTRNGTSPSEARAWGVQYFKGNFERLVRVKSSLDPGNFFRNQQSIPPLAAMRMATQ